MTERTVSELGRYDILVCSAGIVGRNAFAWEAAFLSAGVGMVIGILILLASWKVLERADVEAGTKPEDTPFSEIMFKILGPATVLGIAAYFLSGYLPSSITDLVKPSDIGFLVGSIPIILFFINMIWSLKYGKKADPNPWKATTLEWQTSETPPGHGNWGPELPEVYRWAYDYSVPGAAEDYIPQNQPPDETHPSVDEHEEGGHGAPA